MNELQIFENEQFGQVRTVEQCGQTWFVAADVCNVFGETNRNRAMQFLDDDEKGYTQIDTPRGVQRMAVVNEAGLYALLFAMQPQKARGVSEEYVEKRQQQLKEFKRWITHEVLPSIRKRGLYATESTVDQIISNPDFGIKLLEELKQEREEKRLLEAKVQADAPRVQFAQAVEDAHGDILIGELAKILQQGGADTGEKRLFETLRKDGYLIRNGAERNLPTQRSMELRVMRVVKRTVTLPDGRKEVRNTPKITGKGQIYFMERYGARGEKA